VIAEAARIAAAMLAGVALTSVLGASAGAQPAATVEELANYAGPDRTERLIAGAKKEGTVMLYTSFTVDDLKAVGAAFEAKYPDVKLKYWRGSSEDLIRRAVTEARAGRFDADLFETNGTEMEALVREKLLQPMATPATAQLIPAAVFPHKSWIGTRMNVIIGAYNTTLVKKADEPKSYEDLLDPKWKGKLGIEAEDSDWFATVVGAMGEQQGLDLFKKIVDTNGVSIRKGHTLMANLVAAGEVPMALTTYAFRVEQYKRDGAPVETFVLPPAVARVNGVGMAKKAKNPHAALLFIDFLLTDAQKMIADRQFYPTNTSVRPIPDAWKVTFVDFNKQLDDGAKWEKLWKDIILAKGSGGSGKAK
jgi:iron(III) transport system substrate-binding protein